MYDEGHITYLEPTFYLTRYVFSYSNASWCLGSRGWTMNMLLSIFSILPLLVVASSVARDEEGVPVRSKLGRLQDDDLFHWGNTWFEVARWVDSKIFFLSSLYTGRHLLLVLSWSWWAGMGRATPILTLSGTSVPGERLSERWLSTEHHVCLIAFWF